MNNYHLLANGEPTANVPANSADEALRIMRRCGFIEKDSLLGPLEVWKDYLTDNPVKMFDC